MPGTHGGTITVDMREAMRRVKVTVRMKRVRRAAWLLKLGRWLIRLGCLVANTTCDVEVG